MVKLDSSSLQWRLLQLLQLVFFMVMMMVGVCRDEMKVVVEASKNEAIAPGFDRATLAAATVVPDWLDAYGSSDLRANISVRYTYNNRTIPVTLGVLLARNATQSPPHVHIQLQVNASYPLDNVLLTLLLVDPDAASPANGIVRNYLHWIVSNIPAKSNSSHEIWEIGNESAPYTGPAPPFGFHRYYFLIFQQEGKVNITAISSRLRFSVRDFTKTYKLNYPIGGTFYEVRADA